MAQPERLDDDSDDGCEVEEDEEDEEDEGDEEEAAKGATVAAGVAMPTPVATAASPPEAKRPRLSVGEILTRMPGAPAAAVPTPVAAVPATPPCARASWRSARGATGERPAPPAQPPARISPPAPAVAPPTQPPGVSKGITHSPTRGLELPRGLDEIIRAPPPGRQPSVAAAPSTARPTENRLEWGNSQNWARLPETLAALLHAGPKIGSRPPPRPPPPRPPPPRPPPPPRRPGHAHRDRHAYNHRPDRGHRGHRGHRGPYDRRDYRW